MKDLLVSTSTPTGAALTETERLIFTRALQENDERLPLAKIMEWGALGQGRGRALQDEWARCGWIAKDSGQDNAYCLTEHGKALILGDKPANPIEPEPIPAILTIKPA